MTLWNVDGTLNADGHAHEVCALNYALRFSAAGKQVQLVEECARCHADFKHAG